MKTPDGIISAALCHLSAAIMNEIERPGDEENSSCIHPDSLEQLIQAAHCLTSCLMKTNCLE